MIFVYQLKNQDDVPIYIGSTQNLEKRLAQHRSGIKAKSPKKQLYKTCKENNWTITIEKLAEFERRSDARVFEMYRITSEIVENGHHTLIQNAAIDQGRIFRTNSPFGLKPT